MNASLEYFDCATRSYNAAKTMIIGKTYNSVTAILLQHAAECFVTSMMESSLELSGSDLIEFYKIKNAEELTKKKGKLIRPEDVNKPQIPHRLRYLLHDLTDIDKENDKLFSKYRDQNPDLINDTDRIYHTYSYFRYPQFEKHVYYATRDTTDIIDSWDALVKIREIAISYLRAREVLMEIDATQEMDNDLE